jgi:SAM-dependent methyltransferase
MSLISMLAFHLYGICHQRVAMYLSTPVQPDQQPELWDDHVTVYEAVFEPLTSAFARRALDRLRLMPANRLLDVAAGSGGAALLAARFGVDVLAVDASPRMVSRILERAAEARIGERLRAKVMDGTALALPDASVDSAISTFGVVLFPDAAAGMREIARVLKPGGRVAVVTWTEPEQYEIATRLIGAIAAVRGPQLPPPTIPAQLRFREESAFRALFGTANLNVEEIVRAEECLQAPSARWLARHVEFAPGMAAWLSSLGNDREPILEAFVSALERDQGVGEISLSAVAFIGIGTRAGSACSRIKASRD